MRNFVDYFASPGPPSSTNQIKAEDVISKHDSHSNATAPNPENNSLPPSPPPNNRAKTSYRSSYPPSNRELQDYAAEIKQCNDGGTSPIPSHPSSRAPSLDTSPRPRRSSFCQPRNRHRNCTPSKHVRFSTTDTIFEPFGAQDSQTIDQIMQLLHLPKRSIQSPCIPATSSYSVALRRTGAVHEYPDVVPPAQNVSSVSGSMHHELNPCTSDLRSSSYRAPDFEQHTEGTNKRGRRHSDTNSHSTRAELQIPPRSPSYLRDQPTFRPPTPIDAPQPSRSRPHSRPEDPVPPVEYRSDIQPPLRGIPPQRRLSDAHYETHFQRQASKCAKPHSRTRRNSFTSPTPALNRSSISSDETLVNPETTWVPAAVILEHPHAHVPQSIDEDKPISFVANDGNVLRRKDAQRLPAVPRRRKLLRNIAKIFDN